MSRFSNYDTDDERLPEGMTRVAYDADTAVYTFQDNDGSYWESAPGCQFGQLTQISAGTSSETTDDEPFLAPGAQRHEVSWRHDLMPLLNFGAIIGLSLLLLFWYLHRSASPDTSRTLSCTEGNVPYSVQRGDSCWALGEKYTIGVEGVTNLNKGIDCDKLFEGSQICLPG